MICHPDCPYFNSTPPCGYMCHLTPAPRPHPRPKHTPHIQHIPLPTHVEAIQSVRLIRTSNHPSRASIARLHQTSHSDEHGHGRRVHFTPPPAHRVTHACDMSPYPATAAVHHSVTPRPPVHGMSAPPLHSSPSAHVHPIPTIYILTFAADSYPNAPTSLGRLLASQLPAGIPHLYTLDLRALPPPPSALCARYSGISPVLQDAVMSSPVARKLVHEAVRDLLNASSGGGNARGRMREVSMSVCCHLGTHRSVSVAERIAQGVKAEVGKRGCGEGVRVVVRHVSRIKGVGDPF
ncbi:hypothetical protein DE146DRAFT_733152 [Phaeosphaeria sp. MPI-PUGE-AT-0046c]|nr:hypothetical protein DE146DRAFT_733152 [Phaeosphaeria sp. MPI-PUGE-AT-0046c]